MHLLRYIPFFAIQLVIYNVIMFASDVFKTNPGIIKVPLLRNDEFFYLTASELFVSIGVIFLFFEVLKATRTSRDTLIDHVASVGVLILCIIEFLVVPGAGTSAFLMLTLLSLIDVITGFTVTFATSRRDVTFGTPQ